MSVVSLISSWCALSEPSSEVCLPSCEELMVTVLLRLWGSVGIFEAVVARHTLGNPVGIIGRIVSEVHVHGRSIQESEHKMRRANQPRLREPDVDQVEQSRQSHMPTKQETNAI